MSSDVAMTSDDDAPLVAKPANGHVVSNGNGHVNGDAESSLSEDDDIPLSQSTRAKSEPETPKVQPRKRKKPVFSDSSSSEDETPLASSPAKNHKSAAIPMPGAFAATTMPASAANGNAKQKAKAVKSEASDAEADNDSDDDAPIVKKKRAPAKTNGKAKAPPKKKVKKEESDDDVFKADSEDDKPLNKPAPKRKRKAKAESDADDNSEDEKPVKKKTATKKAAGKKAKKEEDAGSDTPKPKRKSKAKKEEGDDSPRKAAKKKKEEKEAAEAEAEEVHRWWEAQQANGDGTKKWTTLEHSGVIFPPPYEPLPSHVKMKYNGKPVDLPPESEEVAGFYGAMIETDHAQDETFNKNFFEDWKNVLSRYPPRDGTKITNFAHCDFRPMYEYFEEEKAKRKALSTAEKKELKKAKDEMEAKYATCLLDGRKEKVGNFRVEPPGLFRGRGDHPKKGALKRRIRPENITLNIGKGVPIPVPNMPGQWKDVIHDNTVTWLANWTENINNNHKYVFLAAGSSLKGQSDMMKFEKARELKKHVDKIRLDYRADLRSKVMADRQRATAMYFIDHLALRAGNEKGEDEADTVGCCSLRCKHLTLQAPSTIVFDFLGKDSIRYYNPAVVDAQVFKNVRIFKENKNDDDNVFDRVTTTALNKHLASYMKGLTAKVFRTYNASITFQQQLDEGTPKDASVQEKLNAYNNANRLVAVLCNHQRSAPKTHEQSMEKMKEKVRGLKYDRMKLRHVLFEQDSSYKKKAKYKDDESDIDDDFIASHEDSVKAKEIEKAEKKFAKENEKLAEDDKEPQDDSVLKKRIAEIEADFKRLKKERGTGKATLKRERTTEKLVEAIDKLEEKIRISILQMEDRDSLKEVSLGTSKINYLDPRITAAWCKIHDVPIEKIFSKTLLTKFPWALEVEADWKF
ncbi:hypothetical protein PLICRDRAFT_172532 [Plicaturopsis crispa FD-325 SS-3]|nr:hypothetical protein PLICRDRAFT_172532 [Plicaturopsis crispa FD-325 SS-3]